MKREFITEPYLLSKNPASEMKILWVTRDPHGGAVFYGNGEVLTSVAKARVYPLKGLKIPRDGVNYAPTPEENDDIDLYVCVATVEGKAGERVFYRCVTGRALTKVYDFHFAPPAGEDYAFLQVSDLQGKNPCEKTLHKAGCLHPDFLLYAGDCVTRAWRADDWFDLDAPWTDEVSRTRAFFPCMQQENGARLMQYCPTFVCPGNHEVNDLRYGEDKAFSRDEKNWSWSIFMQLFRPYYEEADEDASLTAKRWYSLDYADLHITSLSVARWAKWEADEAPGWRLFDEIAPASPQYAWLEKDLADAKTPFKWVIEHWHLLNKGRDVQVNLCQPKIGGDGKMIYPDDNGAKLMALFAKNGVNAVSYGHSHVYERYLVEGVHYIEAAYFGVCYHGENEPLHPSGLAPIVEEIGKRSFLVVRRENGRLTGYGYYADEEEPKLFDRYVIAPNP